MEKKEILEKLKEIFKMVVSNKVDLSKVTYENDIVRDLGINSVGVLYMAIAIEKVFNVDMTQTSITSFNTVGDVVSFIEEKTK